MDETSRNQPLFSAPLSRAIPRDGMLTSSSSGTTLINGLSSQQPCHLTLVRKQIDAVDHRLESRIEHVQEQSDRIIEAKFSRFDQKFRAIDEFRPDMERKMNDMTASMAALTAEMKLQVDLQAQRSHGLEDRFREWRCRFEAELRESLCHHTSNEERQPQQYAASVQSALPEGKEELEDLSRKFTQLENLVVTTLREQLTSNHQVAPVKAHGALEEHSKRLEQLERIGAASQCSSSFEAALSKTHAELEKLSQRQAYLENLHSSANHIQQTFADTSSLQASIAEAHTILEGHAQRFAHIESLRDASRLVEQQSAQSAAGYESALTNFPEVGKRFEELSQRLAHLEAVNVHSQDIQPSLEQASSFHAPLAEAHDVLEQHTQRLAHLESILDIHGGFSLHNELPGGILGLKTRLDVLEEESLHGSNSAHRLIADVSHHSLPGSEAALMACEHRLTDSIAKVGRLSQDVLESQSRIEEHSAKLKALKSRVDSHDDRHGEIRSHVESSDMRSHVEQLQQSVQREFRRRDDGHQRLDVLSRRVEELEESHLELAQEARGEHKRLVHAIAGPGLVHQQDSRSIARTLFVEPEDRDESNRA